MKVVPMMGVPHMKAAATDRTERTVASREDTDSPSVATSHDHLRVGIFTPTYPGVNGEGGIGTYTQSLARGLTRLGHEVHVLTTGIDQTVCDEGVTIHPAQSEHLPVLDRVLPGSGACFRLGRAMQRLVERYGLDVIEFPNWEGLAIYFAARRRVPLVMRMHTSSHEAHRIDGGDMTRLRRFDVRRERWSALMADALITHSEAHRRTIAEELGIDPAKIEVIPHGIDAPAHPMRERDPCAVLFLGRLETRKGVLDLLHAVPAVLRAVPNAHFYLIGEDRAHCPGGRTHAEYLYQEFPPAIRSRVTLLGRLPSDEVDRWHQRAAVFVAPSIYESFGLVLLEAMRWGTPVVATRAGGIPEVVENGMSGLLVSPGAPEELAEAISELLLDPVRRHRLGEAGRERYRTQFSTERMADRVAKSYEAVLARWSRS